MKEAERRDITESELREFFRKTRGKGALVGGKFFDEEKRVN